MTFIDVNKMWLETHDIEIRKQEREMVLSNLKDYIIISCINCARWNVDCLPKCNINLSCFVRKRWQNE